MKLEVLSEKHGKSKTYFSAMKNDQKEKFEYIMSFHHDNEVAVDRYIEYVENVVFKVNRAIKLFSCSAYAEIYKDAQVTRMRGKNNLYQARRLDGDTVTRLISTENYLSIGWKNLQKFKTIIKFIEDAGMKLVPLKEVYDHRSRGNSPHKKISTKEQKKVRAKSWTEKMNAVQGVAS